MNQLRIFGTLSMGTALLVACGSKPAPVAEPEPPPAETATAVVEAPPPPALPAVEFVAGTDAAAPAKAPSLAIKAPKKDQVIAADKAGDFEVKLDLKDWSVPEGGNHVHVILDNRPYKRIDDAKAPIKLKDLDPSYTLAEGQHVLVAFPSRSTHESVKPTDKTSPLAVTTFWVGKKGAAEWKMTDPTLVFSRPKGKNDGQPPAEGILVDWYLANAKLGEGAFSIQATLTGPGAETGIKATIKGWNAWRIKNPQDGTYTLQMTLMGADGKPVPGAWNDTKREFSVDSKAASDAHGGHAPAAAEAGAEAAPAAAKK